MTKDDAIKAIDERYAEQIKGACMSGDFEGDHSNADDILRSILIELGFDKTVDAYNAVGKWYA
jgi:hypothetical protein